MTIELKKIAQETELIFLAISNDKYKGTKRIVIILIMYYARL